MVQRIWMPSQHYSTGRGTVRLITLHTTEGSQSIESLRNWLTNPSSKVSYHCAADNHRRGQVGEFVKRHHTAWSQANFNSIAVSCAACTPAGAASGWSRDRWLNQNGWMLENMAAWVAEEARAYGIPLVALTASQAQGGGRGVCQHRDLGSGGGNHHDCGPGFPMDWIIAKAKGTTLPPAGGGSAPPSTGTSAPKMTASPYISTTTNSRHPDVRTWQSKMKSRGWSIGVDQIYGAESERVCRSFQSEKGLTRDGILGPQTWSATWTSPVT